MIGYGASSRKALPLTLCGLLVGVVVLPLEAADAAEPVKANRSIEELTGPIRPSIMVPPVRRGIPALTDAIVRPPQYDPKTTLRKRSLAYQMESLRLAIEDLMETFGETYRGGREFLRRWEALEADRKAGRRDVAQRFAVLRNEALLANPLLDFDRLLLLKRRRGQLGLPTNHQCNTALPQAGYDNELAILSPVRPDGRLSTVYRPPGGRYVGEMDLHFDGDRLLFTMPNGRTWQIHEIGIDGRGLRQVSQEVPDVDNFDACYLPDGRIVFASTASFTGVPCWHGRERACCLFLMNEDGSEVRQLCYDQDLDLHPSVLPNGQIIYSRWDYTGILHAYVRPLMVMNPDGTGQRSVYGSNCYYPNCLFFPRAVPGKPNRLVSVLAGYHGKNRMGELVVLDVGKGWRGGDGIIARITHRDEPIVEVAIDALTVKAQPQFLHPYPLSDKYILTAMQPRPKAPWGIYLVDVFDNIVPIMTDEQYDYFEPIPVKRQPLPPTIPDRVDLAADDAVVVIHDIYQGPGLKGVPRGTIKRLRVGAYEFGFPGMAGPDKVGRAGPWEVMRILGTVPVYEDGSAKFRVPANVPLTLQPLDAEGKAVQLMRSWYTAMPGETTSCVGCHETPRDTPVMHQDLASLQPPVDIEPWYGPPRGFDFAREVQPVLDRHCVHCHNGRPDDRGKMIVDLRSEDQVPDYRGLPLTHLGASRLDPLLVTEHPDRFPLCEGMPLPYGDRRTFYTPAYEALIPFIRRVNIEDGAELLRPGEYYADTSELVLMLQKGHHGVQLDRESWDRLITWIDLNGPCHGTWQDVAEVPHGADRRRRALAAAPSSSESVPTVPVAIGAPTVTTTSAATPSSEARREAAAQLVRKWTDQQGGATSQPARNKIRRIDLGEGQIIELVLIQPGSFVMGDTTGEGDGDEWPAAIVDINKPFWISRTEITNGQLRRLFPDHHSGYFTKRQIDRDGPGIQLDGDRQPAMRVTWLEAMEFCRLLGKRTKLNISLPTEGQWEYAARAGTTNAMFFGQTGDDFAPWANMADRSLTCIYEATAGVAALQPLPARMDVDDQAIATARVASYQPNPWGLYDVHGNAGEWTRSAFRPYPYSETDGRNDIDLTPDVKRVVRGGSFYDRPKRSRASHRRAYLPWQSVHDVGFRIVIEDK